MLSPKKSLRYFDLGDPHKLPEQNVNNANKRASFMVYHNLILEYLQVHIYHKFLNYLGAIRRTNAFFN